MNELKLNQVRNKLRFKVNYGLADISIRNLLNDNHYEIDWDVYLPTKGKNLQRGFVWTLNQKRELIYSIFKGIQLAPISVISFEHKIYKIIDGKQRLSTLLSFCKNEFSIFWNNQEYFFNNLDGDIQRELLGNSIRANIGYEYYSAIISDDEKIAWFEMINFSGTVQDEQHLKNLKS